MLYGELPEVVLLTGETVNGIKARTADQSKTAVLRLPTNSEMLARLKSELEEDRRNNRWKDASLTKDLDLFNLVRLDKGDAWDEFEASSVISKLTYCAVRDFVHNGDEYAVTIDTKFGNSVHLLRVPSAKDVAMYRRAGVAKRGNSSGFSMEAVTDLYRSVIKSASGYASTFHVQDMPPHHMAIVVGEVIAAVDSFDPFADPNS